MEAESMKRPGTLAVVSLVGVVAIGYEMLTSTGHLLHAHLGGWMDDVAAVLTRCRPFTRR